MDRVRTPQELQWIVKWTVICVHPTHTHVIQFQNHQETISTTLVHREMFHQC